MAGTPASAVSEPSQRSVFFDGQFGVVSIYDSNSVSAGSSIAGPAIIEQDHGVVVVPPGAQAVLDTYGNVIVESKESN